MEIMFASDSTSHQLHLQPQEKHYHRPHHSAAVSPAENRKNEAASEGWQETRKIVDAYLKRSLSQNAKSSTNFLKPEGEVV